jgi:hypothetical protein
MQEIWISVTERQRGRLLLVESMLGYNLEIPRDFQKPHGNNYLFKKFNFL